MYIESFLVAGGNQTALVWGCASDMRNAVATALLADKLHEQVGFIDEVGTQMSLRMMGDELCVNATLALASRLSNGDTIRVSGVRKSVTVVESGVNPSVILPLTYEVSGSTVLFEGIGFVCIHHTDTFENAMLKTLAEHHVRPAFGVVRYGDEYGSIMPTVYVDKTKTCVDETACGSGSIVLIILTGRKKIIQPSKQALDITMHQDGFLVSGPVMHVTSYERSF